MTVTPIHMYQVPQKHYNESAADTIITINVQCSVRININDTGVGLTTNATIGCVFNVILIVFTLLLCGNVIDDCCGCAVFLFVVYNKQFL